MTVETLINTYEKCVSSLRKSQATRRTTSLKRITPVTFSKQVCTEDNGGYVHLLSLLSFSKFAYIGGTSSRHEIEDQSAQLNLVN